MCRALLDYSAAVLPPARGILRHLPLTLHPSRKIFHHSPVPVTLFRNNISVLHNFMMQLCKLCSSIPFQALPLFPQEQFVARLTGRKYIHQFYRKKNDSSHTAAATTAGAAVETRVKHHPSIELVREAAAGGCNLCTLIQGQADLLLAELEDFKESRSGRGRPYFPPSFDMWLTQRPDGGQGFWVMSEASVDGGGANVIMPIAAFGFVVEAGMLYPPAPSCPLN